jgi:alpha-D-ribose 1-methylphosphonate 5-triphosphate synthase subunit PhnI
LARGESGAMVCLAYSAQRGFGGDGGHGTIGELRVGDLPLRVVHPLIGEPVTVGWFRATEVEMFGRTTAPTAPSSDQSPVQYGMSYGLVFGQNERKAIAMAMLDSSLQSGDGTGPAADPEMVLYHTDGIESTGFVEHLKLPHFVTFGSGLQLALERKTADPSLAGGRS